MPIKGLTDREASFPEIGSIRKGAPKPEDGKRPGADLKYFRAEFDEREADATALFAKIYGTQPTEFNILFPFNEIERNFDAWRETYVAGALIHRCDGERIWYEIDSRTGERLIINGAPNKGCNHKSGCKPVGRMKVIIPELARLAYLVVHTTSIHDIVNLSRQLDALQTINGGRLAGIPLKLRRRPKSISTPSGENGKRARREKWLLSVEADPEWVQAKVADMRRASLPESGGTLSIAAPETIEHTARGPVWAEPDEQDGETELNGNDENGSELADTDAARVQDAPPAKPAFIRGLTQTRDWQRGCKDLALKWPKYQTTLRSGGLSGQPSYQLILDAAGDCGFATVSDSNFAAAIEAVATRAAELETEVIQG